MPTIHGGWSGAAQAKPAARYDIQFGHGLLNRKSAAWPAYIAVSSPSAMRAARPELARLPYAVAQPRSLDFEYLNGLSDSLPEDADLVVGIGGGMAIDACKHIALRKGLPVIFAPTVVSTGAIIHSVMAKFEGRNITSKSEEYPWIDPEEVLVDYDVVLRAPANLNTAGLGDLLCGYAGISEWVQAAREGIAPPFVESATAATVQHHLEVVEAFPKTLNDEGGLTPNSVRLIMTAIKDRDVKLLRHPSAPSTEHHFIVAVELANDKSWVHGELAALGAVVVAWCCNNRPETLIERLDRCRVRWRPRDMGMSADELRNGLAAMPAYLSDTVRGRDVDSVLRRKPVAGERFGALWEYLGNA